MSQIATPEHKKLAGKVKNILAVYADAEDLIDIGAYKAGSSEEIDFAISKIKAVNAFLMQDVYEKVTFEECVQMLRALFADDEAG